MTTTTEVDELTAFRMRENLIEMQESLKQANDLINHSDVLREQASDATEEAQKLLDRAEECARAIVAVYDERPEEISELDWSALQSWLAVRH